MIGLAIILEQQFVEHLGQAKKLNPDTITVFGGTNFPDESDQQKVFLDSRPNLDAQIDLEGEIAFSNLVGRILESDGDLSKIWSKAIPGISFSTKYKSTSTDSVLLRGERPPRIKNLDDIPSPYLNGLFDKFFDGRLRPFLETNRGCPFRCSFCHRAMTIFRNKYVLQERIEPKLRRLRRMKIWTNGPVYRRHQFWHVSKRLRHLFISEGGKRHSRVAKTGYCNYWKK